MLSLMAVLNVACTDTIELDNPGVESGGEDIKGEMILFAAGTTTNSISTRADGDGDPGSGSGNSYTETPGKTYYMPDAYRFVCRMYYKAATGENAKYDVSGNTDVTAWLKVKGNVGNSLYWRNSFPELSESEESLFDTYGNDVEATCFYWQNRREHAFLAWTDLNRATTIGYDPTPNSGTLKFQPEDTKHTIHTGQKQVQWVDNGYEVILTNGDTQIFPTWKDLRTYLETDDNYNNVAKEVPSDADFTDQHYYYAYGWSCKYREQKGASYEQAGDENHRKFGWYEYQMFYDKLSYDGAKSGDGIEVRKNAKNEPAYLYNESSRKYLAEIEIKYYKTDTDGNIIEPKVVYTIQSGDINIRTNSAVDNKTVADGDLIKSSDEIVAKCVFEYSLTDDYGNVKYDETNPRYTFYYKLLQEKKETEVTKELPANVYDLTRGNEMTSINDQPDIIQALTIQAPLGATQSANRVNLYFKHQFSLIQVNVKSSADLSVVINKKHIRKVELLGVSDKAYVFTELDEDGKIEPTTYESVDVSKYDDEHLKKNQYGTAFNMFDMATGKDDNGVAIPDGDKTTHDGGYATGYIKSFNAMTFGLLQAIRITWNENEDGSGISHESTYHVADEVLKNLKSGRKYVWNIELRRGTLAIVRTEIVDWIVPANELEYETNGTIYN